MIRTSSRVAALLLFFFFFAVGAVRADCSNDLQVVIVAPVDAVDPVAGTVTVLGLTIAVPATALVSPTSTHHHDDARSGDHGGDGDDDEDEDDDDDDDGGGVVPTPVTLDTLAVGTLVRISLVSDVAPLTATRLTLVGGYEERVKIRGPIQAVDTTANTVTVLGLTIDISTATVEGANDDHSATVPSTPTVLAVGQSAEIELDSTQLPALVALSIEVKNFTNQVGVELDDDDGNQIGDMGDDDSVDCVQTVKAIDPTTGKKFRKTIHIHTTTSTGAFSVSGLAPGRAKVTVSHGGRTYHKTVVVGTNGTSHVKIKIKKHK